jgi:YidC/Oxa1 family membrane protein insertase
MEKRIFTAVLISIGFLWLWAWAAPKLMPEYFKPAKPAPVVPKATPANATNATNATTGTNVAAAPAPALVPAQPPIAVTPTAASRRQISRVETPNFIALFSNRGAELISFQLKHYQSKSGGPVELVKARDPIRTDFPFAVESPNSALAQRLNTALWEVSERRDGNAQIITYRYAADGVAATKSFQFHGDYPFDFSVRVAPAMPYRVAIGPGIRTLDPDEKESMYVVTGNGVVQRDEKVSVVSREKSDKINLFEHVDFIGIEDNYFMSVLRPTRGDGAILHAIDGAADAKGEKRRDFYAGVNALPDGSLEGTSFFVPKQAQLLDRYHLEKTLQFGIFGIIARVFLTVLLWINRYTNNWGWSIIVLTILIKVVLYPLQHKSMSSMKKMQKVQPKVEAIKAKYRKVQKDPEQRQKMNQETMKLYQQEGINPASGCLPLVIQLPILWAFYNLLSHAIELRGAPFMLWIHDLSAKDPYYVTPALMVITMFVQQAMTPTTVDPAQKRMFYIMPLVMGWIFKELPSGVVVYYLMQNVLTIIQQWIMNTWWKDHPKELEKE